MVENVAADVVESKPAKIEAFGDVKPTVNVNLKVKIPFQVHIGHIEEKSTPVLTGVGNVRGIEVDTGSFFITNERWIERDDLLGWVRRQSARSGFTISIDKSSLKKLLLTMQYERSGEYKPPKMRTKPNLEGMGSKKYECSFRLQGFFEKDTKDWWSAMLCGIHNHELAPKLAGHLLAGRLKAEEKKIVIDMTKILAVPRNIFTDLKEKNKESVMTIKQVYNARTRWRKGQGGDKTKMQYLISKLEEHKYVYFTRENSEETTLEDIFFSHPESVNMLNTFPTILVMDYTYKTHTYRMSLFEIVGVTTTKNDVFCWFCLYFL